MNNIDLSKHISLLEKVASRLCKYNHNPPFLTRDDLISMGYFGLLEASKKYDSKHSSKLSFERYAAPYIYQRIIDQIRSLSWAPRTVVRAAQKNDELSVNQIFFTGHFSDENVLAMKRVDVDFKTETKELEEHIKSKIKNPKYATIISMYICHNMTKTEIASAIKMSKASIGNIVAKYITEDLL